MQYLKIDQLSKTYGEKVLLDNISFSISKGDKIALVAKNGSGKSTLMRIMAGEDTGEGEKALVQFSKGITVGFLKQEPALNDNHTVLEEVFSSDFPALKAVRDYELATYLEDSEGLQEAMQKIEDHEAWNIEAQVKEILHKLDITKLDQKIGSMSGGEKKRVALCKLLIEEPDFIILDEPTNHLDVEMIEWLEGYFKKESITLLVVTHDRYFIEAVCNEIKELDNGIIHSYRGGYSDYLEKKNLRQENDAQEFGKLTQLYKKELEWVRRQPKARGTKSKARTQDFQDVESVVKSQKKDEKLKIEMKEARLGKKILELHNIGKSYGDKKLIEGFKYKFKKGERIGIAGKNGAGKTTFLKLITQEIEPDQGKVIHGETVVFGYYTQSGMNLKEEKRVIDVVRDIAEYIPLEKGRKLTAEKMLENFLFPRPQQQVYVSQLSGGERKRLYLLTILMKNPNFLILDEPTNDLDILTLNILEEYLQNFQGCIMVVSHDRYFMDKLVDSMFVFEGDGVIRNFNGNYTDFRASQNKKPEKVSAVEQVEEKKSGKLDHERRKEIRNLEKGLEKLNARKAKMEEKFLDPNLTVEELTELTKSLNELKEQIDEKEMAWLELSE